MKLSEVFNLRIGKGSMEDLKYNAKSRNMSSSELIRTALEKEINPKETETVIPEGAITKKEVIEGLKKVLADADISNDMKIAIYQEAIKMFKK